MRRVDPEGVLLRALTINTVNRRKYQVYAPLALWHIDGNHKLIRILAHICSKKQEDIASFAVLLLVFKALNGLAPCYISDLLNKRSSVRSLRSCSQGLLNIPKSRTKTYGDRAFSIAGPRLWNELPLSFRSVSDINVFKRSLKTHLFQHAYSGYV